MGEISDALLEAYSDTAYVVSALNGFTLRVGVTCPALDRLLLDRGFNEAAFITAFNPFSQRLPDQENQHRHSMLLRALEAENLSWLAGYGKGSDPEWDQEESVLVLGVSLESALALGREFEQHAILFYELNSEARLERCF